MNASIVRIIAWGTAGGCCSHAIYSPPWVSQFLKEMDERRINEDPDFF
jgi:hypothetical protein